MKKDVDGNQTRGYPLRVSQPQNKMKTTTTFTKSEWESMETVSEATKTTGKIKSRNGSKYEWIAGGKRVTTKKI